MQELKRLCKLESEAEKRRDFEDKNAVDCLSDYVGEWNFLKLKAIKICVQTPMPQGGVLDL